MQFFFSHWSIGSWAPKYTVIWVTLSESFRTSIRGFSGSNHEDIFWNFPNWSTSNLRNWVSIYRQLQADCLYHVNCLYNFPAYTWRQKRNAFPGLCSGSIFMIQKNLIIILGTEPRILCSEVIRKNNSSMTQLSVHCSLTVLLSRNRDSLCKLKHSDKTEKFWVRKDVG